MKQNKLISLILSFILIACGDSSTQGDTQPQQTQEDTQPQQTQEDTQPQQIQEETQEDTQPQQIQGQGQRNNNPFLDPNYADCLINEFGEERYKQLQNERPTSEEEQRIGKCMGPPQGQGPQGQGPQGQGPQGGEQGQGPQGGEESPEQKIQKAVGIIQNANQEILDCISIYFGGEVYKKVVEDLDPDEFEAGIVINCKEDPSGSTEEAGGPLQPGSEEDSPYAGDTWYNLNVYNYSPNYSEATSNGYTSFGLNEKADLILSGFGFDNSGGISKLNHPVSISSNGEKLAVTDRFNNRVLIWNTVPTKKTSPDFVIGQPNFNSQNPGNDLNQLDFPGQVIITPDNKLLVADSNNGRVLVWTTFPTSSGQSADYALPITNYVTMNNSWPWGVWSNGEKTIVTSTVSGTVLFWNSFPTPSTQPDVTLTSNHIGTPRSILSNGEYVMFGDENANGNCIGQNGNRSTHVYTSWPTSSRDPDACVENWISGVIHENKIYSIPAGGESLYFWDSLYTTSADLKSRAKIALPGEGARWMGGDDGGATVANGKLFIAEYNGNRISVFDSLPTSVTEKPDWSLMTDNTDDYPLLEDDFIIQNPVVGSDGNVLVVSSDFDRSLSVWKNIPGSSGAKPDYVFRRFEEGPWDNTFNSKALFLAGGTKVVGWTDFHQTINSGNYSFDLNTSTIGSISFNTLMGVAYNGTYFVLGEKDNKNIYIWEDIPDITDEPIYILQNPVSVGRIDMNEEWLVISSMSVGSSVHAIKLSELNTGILRPIPGYDNFTQGVSVNEKGLFLAVQGDDKVYGWSSVEDALNGVNPTMSFGGSDDKTSSGTKMASTVHWDGYHLWVGEYKFSNRLLGFAPSK